MNAIELILFTTDKSLTPLLAIKRPKYREKTSKAGNTFLYLPSLGLASLKGMAKKTLIMVMREIDNNQIVSDGPIVLRFCFLTGLTSVSEETFNFISLKDSLEKFSDSSEKKRLPFLILKLSFIDSST